MKKLDILILGGLILSVMSCGPKEQEVITRNAMVNQPVQLEVQSDMLAGDDMVEWTFTELPARTASSSVEFRPSHSSPQISFTPPDTGTYRIRYTIMNAAGDDVYIQPYLIRVNAPSPQQENTMGQPPSQQEAAPSRESTSQSTPGTTPTTSPETLPADAIPKQSDELTVQISAWKTFSKAETMANQAREMGYNPYIQRARFPNGEVWYRVRIGQYSTYTAAKTVLNKLSEEPAYVNHDLWIDFRREDT